MECFSFETQGTNTYLIYNVSQDDNLDSMSLGMLTNNKIAGIVQTQFLQIDTQKIIKFNVTAHISVSQFLSGVVNKKRLIGVFKGVVDAMLSAEEYMLDANSIVLDLDYIFADVSSCETILVCLPINNIKFESVNLKDFFKNIIFTTQFDQTENCDYIAKIINYLNGVQIISLEDFKALLDSLESQAAPVYAQPSVQSAPIAQPVQQARPLHPAVQQPVATKPVQPVATQQPAVKPQPAQVKKPPVQKPAATSPATKQSFAVPQNAATHAEPEQKMSMFYLLQHYNKENAAIYKAQKEAKKNGGKTVDIPDNKPAKKNDKNKVASKSTANVAFAVPGQAASAPQSFAVSGQTPKSVAPKAPQAQPMVQQAVPMSQPIAAQPKVLPQTQTMNFGETTVLNSANSGETTVLSSVSTSAQPKPHLIRMKNNENINLDKPVFRIGKEKSYVDYFIGDNTAISRSHANIVCRDGECFIVDTNSTNHTYLNGSMIQSNVETKLTHGDIVRLANEEFEFKFF